MQRKLTFILCLLAVSFLFFAPQTSIQSDSTYPPIGTSLKYTGTYETYNFSVHSTQFIESVGGVPVNVYITYDTYYEFGWARKNIANVTFQIGDLSNTDVLYVEVVSFYFGVWNYTPTDPEFFGHTELAKGNETYPLQILYSYDEIEFTHLAINTWQVVKTEPVYYAYLKFVVEMKFHCSNGSTTYWWWLSTPQDDETPFVHIWGKGWHSMIGEYNGAVSAVKFNSSGTIVNFNWNASWWAKNEDGSKGDLVDSISYTEENILENITSCAVYLNEYWYFWNTFINTDWEAQIAAWNNWLSLWNSQSTQAWGTISNYTKVIDSEPVPVIRFDAYILVSSIETLHFNVTVEYSLLTGVIVSQTVRTYYHIPGNHYGWGYTDVFHLNIVEWNNMEFTYPETQLNNQIKQGLNLLLEAGTQQVNLTNTDIKALLTFTAEEPVNIIVTQVNLEQSIEGALQVVDAFDVTANISSLTVTIRVYYSEENLPQTVNETTLSLYCWDSNSQSWVKIQSTVNTELNYVEATVNHLTIFTVYGETVNTQATPPLDITLLTVTAGIIVAVAVAVAILLKKKSTFS
ncbi:MAG: hypothetical protein ACTSSJ_07290 [Candidatus Odinarchaeia archaeon]